MHPASPEFHWATPRIPNLTPPAPCQTSAGPGGLVWSTRLPGRACFHIKTRLVSQDKKGFLLVPVAFLHPDHYLTDLSATNTTARETEGYRSRVLIHRTTSAHHPLAHRLTSHPTHTITRRLLPTKLLKGLCFPNY
ncbi:hypothetical protein VTI28DRAFT_3795 [Corynascus sepedonium]